MALGFPVVTLVPFEPDAFAEPLVAFPVEEASSLSSLLVDVGLSDDCGASVVLGTSEEAWSESSVLRQYAT